MKKYLFFLLALLPMALAFSACSDDNDLPDVEIPCFRRNRKGAG